MWLGQPSQACTSGKGAAQPGWRGVAGVCRRTDVSLVRLKLSAGQGLRIEGWPGIWGRHFLADPLTLLPCHTAREGVL